MMSASCSDESLTWFASCNSIARSNSICVVLEKSQWKILSCSPALYERVGIKFWGTDVKVYVELAHQLDAAVWQQENRQGRVPNELPFGLEAVAARGVDLQFRRPPVLRSRVRRAVNRLNRQLAGLQWVESALWSQRAERRRSELVLAWDEWTGIPAAWRAVLPGEPPVVSGIMNLTDWPGLKARERGILRRGMLRCAKLFQHSGAQADLLTEDWGIPQSRIALVPFGVDPLFFRPMPVEVKPGLVVSVGDDAHRDYPGLFEIFTDVRRCVRGAELFVATTSRLPRPAPDGVQVVREKLADRRPEVYSSAAVVAVHCRLQVHGSGLSVVVEAMACGRPWVATDSIGFHDHFSDGDGGILVPPGDRKAFAAAVTRLLRDPDEATGLGNRGRALVESRLNTDVQGAHVAEVLKSVAA
jgi:glycosyltransferase involved in cell wall biosynthesis